MRALVLSGGGGLGAYQVGALSYLLGERRVRHSIVVGTSVGAVNGAEIAMHAQGQEIAASDSLCRQWYAMKTSDVVSGHFGGPLALLTQPSLQSTEPLRRLLNKRLDMNRMRASGRAYRAVAVDIVTGKMHLWGETDTKEHLITGILASAATPVLHPNIRKGGHVFYDGGLRDVSPIRQAIALGATEVDVVLTLSDALGEWNPEPDRVWNTALRTFEVMFRELVRSDLRNVELYNALVEAGKRPDKRVVKVNVLRPEKPLPMDASAFEPAEIRTVMEIGRRDAEAFSGW